MFELLARKFFRTESKTHILAVDLATSFISTAVVVAPGFSVVKIFRYPLNLAGLSARLGEASGNTGLPQVFKDAFLKIFRDARGVGRHLDAILLGLADPFFLEAKLSKKIIRKDPKSKIARDEVENILKELENDVKHQYNYNSLLPVSREIVNIKINGYSVDNAERYAGKTLEISAIFTLITSPLRDFFEDAKAKFFPGKQIYYFSDAMALRRQMPAGFSASVIFNIDGEVTSVFYWDGEALSHIGMAPFGFSTVSRRLASSFKITAEDAAQLLRRYLDRTLEESYEKKVGSVVESAEKDWWIWLENYLKILRLKAPPKFILTGREQNLDALVPFFKNNLEKFYGADISRQALNQNEFIKNFGNNRFLTWLVMSFSW